MASDATPRAARGRAARPTPDPSRFSRTRRSNPALGSRIRFILSRDVVACLREAAVEISEKASTKKDLRSVQAAFNAWKKESGLSYAQMSRVCAMSAGENVAAAILTERYAGGEGE